jgi:hypothetical protein
MKNSTLVRIRVPKALYESALKKALLEAGDKEHKAGHKGNKFAKEDDYSKKAKVAKPTAKHTDKEPKKGGGAHKGKAFVKDDAYVNKVSAKKSLGENKKKMKEATEIEKFRTLTPNREISKDTHRMQERKRKIKENEDQKVTITLDEYIGDPAMYDIGKWAADLIPALKNMSTSGDPGQQLVDLGTAIVSLAGVGTLVATGVIAAHAQDIKNAAKKLRDFIVGKKSVKEGTNTDQELAQAVAKLPKQTVAKIAQKAGGATGGTTSGMQQERKRKMEEKKKMEERKHKIKEAEKHDDVKADTKLIKKLVKPTALKGSK